MKIYKALHLFAGIGGGALGFQNAKAEYRGIEGKIETICGIDVDPDVCEDFENITGARAVQMDLFNLQQYIDFHDKEPIAEWKEVTAAMLRQKVGEVPDIVFTSPPCKGFSGLLPQKSAKTKKYQALNQLTVRSIRLTLEAFSDDLPALILLENVPRITTRGAGLLKEIKQQLELYGYEVNDEYHDCGEIGGLGQHRKRYLLIARNPLKLNSFVYKPPKQKVKTIGDILNSVPLPGQGRFGKIHELPRLQWKTWLRLALIPAGGDWRDLEKCDWENIRLTHEPRSGAYGVADWEEPSGAITGARGTGQSNSTTAIADPRTGFSECTHSGIYRVQKWDESGRTITGAMRPNNGAPCIADPRNPSDFYKGEYQRVGGYGVQDWDKASLTIRGAARIQNAQMSINDPRLMNGKRYSNKWQMEDWDKPAATVTGITDIQSGAQSISDPRLSERKGRHPGVYQILKYNEPSSCVTGTRFGSGAPAIEDPRLNCSPRTGTMGVLCWDETAKTVTGSNDVHAGTSAVADPRIPSEKEQGIFIIIAEDGTWHRPLTTLELAVLQSLPLQLHDGSPLRLTGNSDAKWRERIGNMVPPAAAHAIGETMLRTLLAQEYGDWLMAGEEIWVREEGESSEISKNIALSR